MILTDRIKDNPLAMAIFTTMSVMKADYIASYNRNFTTPEDEKLVLNRMHQELKNIKPRALIDAYDNVTELDAKFMPDVAALIKEAKRISWLWEKDALEAEQVEKQAALPNPETIDCNPMEMLAEAMENKGEGTRQDAIDRLERETAHLRRDKDTRGHQCSYHACFDAGTLTQSTNGSERWYCSKHYIQG